MMNELDIALARIETLEAEKAHLLKVIKERKIAGWAVTDMRGNTIINILKPENTNKIYQPVYYISDEYDAAGFLITPEVKIEQ